MNQNYLHDQRGVAMLLELVLVAAVLALVGVALYQSNNHPGTASTAAVTSKPAAATSAAVGLADSAAAISETESASDASLSAAADATTSVVSETDVDVTNLGGSTSANSY